MPTYLYKAMNTEGRRVKGEVLADNALDLEHRLNELGLDLIDWKEGGKGDGGRFSKISSKDMIIMCLQMEQLSRAGVPLLETLVDVRDSTESPKLKNIITNVHESVRSGKVLSEALAEHPDHFDEVFVGLIRAGEQTGDMSEVYQHLGNHFKWTNDLRRKVRKAVGYPMFLLFIMTGVISVLMIFVVPKLIDFITSQGFDIPIHTRMLIATSEAFVAYWPFIFGVPLFTLVGGFFLYKKSDNFAYKVDKIALDLPFVGDTFRKINLARFTHFFSVMFKSGIDILDALDASRNIIGNRKLRESVVMVRNSVSDGTSLTESMRMSNEFPNMVVRMFKVGENSGNMNEALENVNFFYEREVNDAVDTMVGMIQPALTIVMGALIFWVVSAVFGPLYQAFSDMPF